jgi:hypothetical protein
VSTKYVMVRVPAEVAAELRSFCDSLEDQAPRRDDLTLPDLGNTGKCECPLWFGIKELLRRRQAKAERSARAAARARSRYLAQRDSERGCLHPSRPHRLDEVA